MSGARMGGMQQRITVVGGGVIGLAVAWRLAQRGAAVTVVDPETEQAASRVAAGMLAPVTEIHFGEEPLLALNLESARRYPAFVAELEAVSGIGSGYRETGTLAVARDRDDLAELDRIADYQQRLGLTVDRLRSRQCRDLEPGLAPSVRGGYLVSGDHQVDPRRLVLALRQANQAAGVRHQWGVTVAMDATTVHLDDGRAVEADVVVLCAGAWTGRIEGAPPETTAVRPVKGQLLRLRAAAGGAPISRTVRGLDAYVVPRADGEVIVGATVEDRGFDTTVTGRAVHDLLRAGIELVPDIGELALTEPEAGLRPGTPDNGPLLGWSSVEGVAIATGHYRNGVLLAPVTADLLAGLVVDGAPSELLAPFTPDRFDRARR